MNAIHRLKRALERPTGPVPFSLVLTLPDARELYDLAAHTADHLCEDCGEPVCCDPSPCDHHVICSTCWPSTCQQCQAELDVEMRGA